MAGLTAIAIERAARLAAGQRVAIIGAAGGVGTILLQLLRQRHVHITATAHPGDAQLMCGHGANEVVPYARGENVCAMLAARRPDGFDVVIDLVNQGAALEAALALAIPGGRFISTLFGPAPERYRDRLELIYIRLAPESGDLEKLVARCAAGALDANLGQIFTFAQALEAFARLKSGQRGKTVIDLTDMD
jgi:NADPH:quinone reductase-like Zn-dependent oxidoreductase